MTKTPRIKPKKVNKNNMFNKISLFYPTIRRLLN